MRDNGLWQLVYSWTHVRRRFVKRFESDGPPIADETLRQIALHYQIEKTVRGNDAAVRLAARREHAAPIIVALKPWLEAQLTEDIRYTQGHWPGLIRFLDNGTLELGKRYGVAVMEWLYRPKQDEYSGTLTTLSLRIHPKGTFSSPSIRAARKTNT